MLRSKKIIEVMEMSNQNEKVAYLVQLVLVTPFRATFISCRVDIEDDELVILGLHQRLIPSHVDGVNISDDRLDLGEESCDCRWSTNISGLGQIPAARRPEGKPARLALDRIRFVNSIGAANIHAVLVVVSEIVVFLEVQIEVVLLGPIPIIFRVMK